MKKISIKSPPYNFINDMVNIKNFDPNLLNIDKLSRESANINIYIILNKLL